MDEYQRYIHTSRYARWLEEENRRETWAETVDRYVKEVVAPHTTFEQAFYLAESIEAMDVMPSMRAMMTAGAAASRDNTCLYNCYYNVVDSIESFSEAMFVLMCGTGVGFSVERQYITNLPVIPETLGKTDLTYFVQDSKEGWADGLKYILSSLYGGTLPNYSTMLVRAAGSRLKTFGGRASGPEPLEDLFNFIIAIFVKARGRKLTSLECHDIMCKIAEVVIVGGVRRSALISLSNLSDDRMRHAKTGQWWESNAQRALANNSAVYTERPDSETFMREWLSLVESKSGERGIFNRDAASRKVESLGRRKFLGIEFGTNPCSEIILRPGQFCNLTEVIVRSEDTVETLKTKVRTATILGTIQSTYTHFPYLRDFIKENTEEERLLGVSLTGIMDNVSIWSEELLEELRQVAIDTNERWAKYLGVPVSAAITCVKPSGTVSQLVDAASGIHPRHSDYYIRTVRGDNKDPLTQFMISQGFPSEPEVNKPENVTVFSFPVKAPEGSVTREDFTAIEQLEFWLKFAEHWCEHKPSITVNVRDHEWPAVGGFVYDNFDKMSGVSFLPHSDHTYVQAPYQEINQKEYEELLASMPKEVDWSALSSFEKVDTTKSSQTFACTGDQCEVVDI